jgi:hypothetical protein
MRAEEAEPARRKGSGEAEEAEKKWRSRRGRAEEAAKLDPARPWSACPSPSFSLLSHLSPRSPSPAALSASRCTHPLTAPCPQDSLPWPERRRAAEGFAAGRSSVPPSPKPTSIPSQRIEAAAPRGSARDADRPEPGRPARAERCDHGSGPPVAPAAEVRARASLCGRVGRCTRTGRGEGGTQLLLLLLPPPPPGGVGVLHTIT